VGTAEIRDVEALDAHRRHVQAERSLQALQRLHAALAAALGAQPLLIERQAGVALASSRMRRFSPRSAARSSTGPPRRLASASPSAARPPSSRCTTSSAGIDMCPP